MTKHFTLIITLFSFLTSWGQTKEVIKEDFSSNSRNWGVGQTETVEAKIEGGKYLVSHNSRDYSQSLKTEIFVDPTKDYSLEAKMRQTEGDDGYGFGLIVGFDDWDNYATAQISSQGYALVERYYNKKKKAHFPAKKIEDGIVNSMGEWNILKLEKKGNTVTFSVNGKVVDSFDDHLLFVGNNLGFFVSGVMKVEIDEITITRMNSKLDVVENPTLGSELENLGANVNSAYTELNPIITTDDKTIFFAVKNNPNLQVEDSKRLSIMKSEKGADGKWQKAELVKGPVNNKNHNFVISVSPDGNTALFGNTYESDGGSKAGVSYGVKRNGMWQTPKTVEIEDYKNLSDYAEYSLSPDGLTLLIALETEDTYGSRDIYVSFLQDNGKWTNPKNCGPVINSVGTEMTPYVAADGKTVYFSSYGHPGYGSADVFISRRLDDTWTNWSKPRNAGDVINSENFDAYFKIDAQGVYGYMVSGNNAIGMEDIFRIKVGDGLRPDVLNLIAGKVYNSKTNEIIDAAIEYEDLSEGKKLGIAYSTKENGYKIALPKGKQYGFRASAEGFISVSNNIDLTNISKYEEKEVNLYLVPIEKGQSLTLNNLFFDSGKSVLKKESFSELNRIAKVMKANSSMKIEISGHTDSDGEAQKNLILSQNRAKAVLNYLIEKGVSSDNLKSIGFGETKPKATNDTPEGKKQNRRVELKIL